MYEKAKTLSFAHNVNSYLTAKGKNLTDVELIVNVKVSSHSYKNVRMFVQQKFCLSGVQFSCTETFILMKYVKLPGNALKTFKSLQS